jgi:hypothetical protein
MLQCIVSFDYEKNADLITYAMMRPPGFKGHTKVTRRKRLEVIELIPFMN